jgi:hypothetical protein
MRGELSLEANAEPASRAALPSVQSGRIVRQKEPRNLEFPFDRLDTYLTPNESFYIRNHSPLQQLNRTRIDWSVEGAVKNRLPSPTTS